MGDSHVGLQARLMSQALRKMTGALNNSGTTAIFINQLREKIGVMFGSPETTTGGRALKFYSSVRLDVRRIETLKDGTEMVGNRTRVKVVKNKVAPPFKQAEFDIMYGKGISREGGLIDVGVEPGLVRKAGAWYTYEGDQLGQGKENARNFLQRQPRPRQRDREEDPREARRRPRRRQARRRPERRARSGSMTSDGESVPHPTGSVDVGLGVEAWVASARSTPVEPRPVRARGGRRWRRSSRGPARVAVKATRTCEEREAARLAREEAAAAELEADPESVARKILLDQLTGRARTRKELADKLASRACPTRSPPGCSTGSPRSAWSTTPPSPGTWVEPAGSRGRGLARRALAQELRRKGIDDEAAARRWTRSTRATRRRRPRAGAQEAALACAGSTDQAATRRLVGMLARKGYPPAWRSRWSARRWARRTTTTSHAPTSEVPGRPGRVRRWPALVVGWSR